jgi:16S rRNA (adenine(1408)-N(1))-methyltransferase
VAFDVGTGDGRAVLAMAARNPRTLVLGLDANAAGMAEASRRAAAQPRRGGLPNAGFILAAAEAAPSELLGIADFVTVHFPWASLLRGCVGLDTAVAAGLASVVRPGGILELLLAPSGRDGLDGVPIEPAAIARAAVDTFSAHEFDATAARPATDAEIAASGSTWAKRLRSQRPTDRPVMLVRLVRPT